MSRARLTLLSVSAAGRGGGGRDIVVEASAKDRVYSKRPGPFWGRVGDRDKRLQVWNGDLVAG